MDVAYDPAKNARNIEERGLSFDEVPWLDWSTAIEIEDTRRDYGEKRMRAWLFGPDGKPFSVVYTMRGKTMWIISFRRARLMEWRHYAKEAAKRVSDR
jgi:uncharacterized DUF497 family protein